MKRLRALAGAAGPAAFITTWAVLGARTKGYSPVHDPISRLAAAGAPTQAAMTAGLLAFGAGVTTYVPALRDAFPGGAGTAALATAVATVGIASTPLDSPIGGAPHAVAAGTAYLSLAAVPVLAAVPLAAAGRRKVAMVSRLAGAATGACLAASVLTDDRTGLWQRAGLTIGHLWLIASAAAVGLQAADRGVRLDPR